MIEKALELILHEGSYSVFELFVFTLFIGHAIKNEIALSMNYFAIFILSILLIEKENAN